MKEGDRERESGRKSERLEIENERVGGRVKEGDRERESGRKSERGR